MKRTKQIIGAAAIVLATLTAALPSPAQPGGQRERIAEKMLDRRMAHLKEELKLTPEQEPALRSIFESTARQTMELRKKYGKQNRDQGPNAEMRQELRAIHEQTQEKLRSLLNEEQQAKLRELPEAWRGAPDDAAHARLPGSLLSQPRVEPL
jgi:Spy/CpxP family protein refolding chaperone